MNKPKAPGVIVNEFDLSAVPNVLPARTIGLVPGFAAKGPANAMVISTEPQEILDTYGKPSNEAERYFIQSAIRQIELGGSVLTCRVPYGDIADFKYSGFKVTMDEITASANNETFVGVTGIQPGSATYDEVKGLIGGDYNATAGGDLEITPDSFIVVGLNSNNDPYGDGDIHIAIMDSYTSQKPSTRRDWLYNTKPYENGKDCYGENANDTIIDIDLNSGSGLAGNVWGRLEGRLDSDEFMVAVYRYIRNETEDEPYGQMIVLETWNVSLDPTKKDSTGKLQFIEDIINNESRYIRVFTGRDADADDITDWAKAHQKVRIQSKPVLGAVSTDGNYLYSVNWDKVAKSTLTIGDVPTKLDRVFSLAKNKQQVPIDIIVDAGLSTVGAAPSAYGGDFSEDRLWEFDHGDQNGFFDENVYDNIVDKYDEFALERKDLFVIIDPPRHYYVSGRTGCGEVFADEMENYVMGESDTDPLSLYNRSYERYLSRLSNSYMGTYGNWVRLTDPYNKTNYWHPASSSVASLMGLGDLASDPWNATAGVNRAIIANSGGLAINLDEDHQGALYQIGVNNIINLPGYGDTIFGQKTLLAKKSSFDRINVRRLFLWMEKTISRIAYRYAFQNNTPVTRSRFKTEIDKVLEYARTRDGIIQYRAICDESNNTQAVIEANEIVADIYVEAARSGEFVILNFYSTRAGVNLTEVINNNQQ